MKHHHALKPIYVCMLIALTAQSAAANPLGPSVVNGQVGFATTGSTLTVTNTPGAIINWQGFSIAANEVTRFAQQSAASAVLNRVVSSNPSSILGALQSNGQVFLVNPNGIMFGAGSTVDVAGLVATTLNLSDADFLAGRNNFTQVPGAQNISNAGNITAQTGGQIFLIAPNVENTGVITAPNGEILLAAGHSVELVNSNDPSLRVNITAPAGDATNVGQLIASSGNLGLFGTVVRNSGTVSADSAVQQGGRIVFKASQRAEAGGSITANGTSGGSVTLSAAHSSDPNAPGVVIQTGSIQAQGAAGNGGTVSMNADSILSTAAIKVDGTAAGGLINVQATGRALSTSSAQYTANSSHGQGGDILVSANVSNYTSGSYSATGVTGGNLTLAGNEIKLAGAQLDASGTNGGGAIHVGGLMHGAAGFSAQGIALGNATSVFTNSSASFNADALQSGNGGEVVLWSDQAMSFKGGISAKGGALSGNGGMAEVSGLTSLGYSGLTNLSAANGVNGTLLLDPRNITIVAGVGGVTSVASLSVLELIDPTPGAGEGFGSMVTELVNGNIVIASPLDSFAMLNAGAVYLYSATGGLLSTLTGSTVNDQVGSGGVTELVGNGNFVVRSPLWNNGTATTAGAVTWSSGTAGVNGVVSSTNSLVGSYAGDGVGQALFVPYRNNPGLVALSNGNYVVVSSEWNGGRGAVTWGNGASGIVGVVSGATNSLVGSGGGNFVGASGITLLNNGNYVVQSPWFDYYDSSVAAWLSDPGAVTWMNGTNGLLSDGASFGAVSTSNSLLGQFDYDNVAAVTPLTNGNFLATTPVWGGGLFGGGNGKGAVTWINGQTGTLMGGVSGGVVSSANSLVYSRVGDMSGFTITELNNGNYVVASPGWDNGVSNIDAGAVTWGSGTAGRSGVISSANSLVGGAVGDRIGNYGIFTLSNGNYVVRSPAWGSNSTVSFGGPGSLTWVDGSNGNTVNGGTFGAVVSSVNSLVGSLSTDYVGTWGMTELPVNGNLVFVNNYWNGSAGAATWMNGTTGALINGAFGGAISSVNSLVGTAANEQAGSWVFALTNGNYLLTDFNYAGGAGAVTFGLGTSGVAGNVSAANSLVGSLSTDSVGRSGISTGIQTLANGNYLVLSSNWNNYAGAVTFGNGSTGTVGAVSASNSLIGSTGGSVFTADRVGYSPVTLLPGSNYVVNSYAWSQPTGFAHVGAVTWGNGTTGTVGVISVANSLVGSTANDQVGYYGIAVLGSNYVVNSPFWNNGTATAAGAVTFGSGTAGVSGVVSATNSLVGTAVNDRIGSYGVTVLSNGNYVVNSAGWSGLLGAVTWGDGSVGTVGAVTAANSLVGSTVNDAVGSSGVVALGNGNYVVSSSGWNGGFGAVTWANGSGGTVGAVTAANSLVGSTVNDRVGSSGGIGSHIVELAGNGNFVVTNYSWGSAGGYGDGMGAVTWMNGANGKLADGTFGGAISATNSLVGSTLGDLMGSSCDCSNSGYVISLSDGNYAVVSPGWTNGMFYGAGAATLGNGATGSVGTVSAANSLVGTAANEFLGSGAFELIGQPGKVLISNAAANNGKGGVYLLGQKAGMGTLFADTPSSDSTIGAGWIASALNLGTNVVLQANNDITQLIGAAINATTGAGNLTLQAGRSVMLNDMINIAGALSVTANDAGANPAYRSAGAAQMQVKNLFANGIALTASGATSDIVVNNYVSSSNGVTISAGRDLILSNGMVWSNNGSLYGSVGRDVSINPGTGWLSGLFGYPDIGSASSPFTVGGVISMNDGASGMYGSQIHSGMPASIWIHFPNLVSGGYFVNGVEGAITGGASGFYANGQPAVLDGNLHITYGLNKMPIITQNTIFSLTNLPTNNLGSGMPLVAMSAVDLMFKLNPSAAGTSGTNEDNKDNNTVLPTVIPTVETSPGDNALPLPVCRG